MQSLLSKSFASLAALCSPLLAAILALVDHLARQIPPSCCVVCWAQGLRKSYSNTKDKKIALIFDPHTAIYTLKEVDIDLEKNVYVECLPSLTQPVELHGETKSLAQVLVEGVHRKRGLKHQYTLANGFYIMPMRNGTRMTANTNDPHDDQLAELPAPGFFSQEMHPVELPADEITPVTAHPVPPTPPPSPVTGVITPVTAHPVPPTPPPSPTTDVISSVTSPRPPPSPTPQLQLPRPRSPETRKASPLLAPPPRDRASEERSSRSGSVWSGSIEISYTPSHHDEAVEGEKSDALEVGTSIHSS